MWASRSLRTVARRASIESGTGIQYSSVITSDQVAFTTGSNHPAFVAAAAMLAWQPMPTILCGGEVREPRRPLCRHDLLEHEGSQLVSGFFELWGSSRCRVHSAIAVLGTGLEVQIAQ